MVDKTGMLNGWLDDAILKIQEKDARIAALEAQLRERDAEVGRLRDKGHDAREENERLTIQLRLTQQSEVTANRLYQQTAQHLATAREAGARAFAEWCEACGWRGKMNPNRGIGIEEMSELLRRFLSSTGTALAEEKGEEG